MKVEEINKLEENKNLGGVITPPLFAGGICL